MCCLDTCLCVNERISISEEYNLFEKLIENWICSSQFHQTFVSTEQVKNYYISINKHN